MNLKIYLFISNVNLITGYDILFLTPTGSKSHYNFYDAIIYGLSDQGHMVSLQFVQH